MADYNSLSFQEKRQHALDVVREPPVRCPACDTALQPGDLLKHAKRCPGPPQPHRLSRWLTHKEAVALGVPGRTLRRWAAAGTVQVQDPGNGQRYLERDVSLAIARRAAAMPGHTHARSGKERQGAALTTGRIHDPDDEMQQMLTIKEVAQMCRVSERTIRSMRAVKQGPPATKIGKSVRYDRADVEAWLKAQKVSK